MSHDKVKPPKQKLSPLQDGGFVVAMPTTNRRGHMWPVFMTDDDDSNSNWPRTAVFRTEEDANAAALSNPYSRGSDFCDNVDLSYAPTLRRVLAVLDGQDLENEAVRPAVR